jgi:hypothetical protein
MVRAKFRCTKKTTSASCYGLVPPTEAAKVAESEEVTLQAVMGEENKPWSKYTPSGELRMTINNPEAFAQFGVGKDYFIDFTPAE